MKRNIAMAYYLSVSATLYLEMDLFNHNHHGKKDYRVNRDEVRLLQEAEDVPG
jgi:hypothetical protein